MLERTTMLTTAAVALAVSLPVSASAQQDLRNPDRRDPVSQRQELRNPDNRHTASGANVSASARQDLRSPDAVDASRVDEISGLQPQDLRSPDAADAGQRVGIYSPDSLSTVSAPEPSDRGFDWGDAGIGAAGMLGLISLTAGTTLIGARFRRRRRVPAPSQ